MNLKNKYLAFVLDDDSRNKLIKAFPPTFSKVICHHVTLKFFNVTEDDVDSFVHTKEVNVVGYASDEALEALVVAFDGNTVREDDSTYHITHSLEPDKRKPVDSNKVISKNGFVKLPKKITITGSFKLENK